MICMKEKLAEFFKKNTPADVSAWEDRRIYRVFAAIGYILFFIPLTMFPDCEFVRYHANQSLLNMILLLMVATTVSFIPVAGVYLCVILTLTCLVNSVRGIWLSLHFRAAPIPIIGRIRIISVQKETIYM